MGQILNQYSFLWITLPLVLITGAILLGGRKGGWREYLALGVIVSGLIVAWSIMHPRQTPLMEDAQAVQAMIGQGKPVLLEFQSPY